MATRRVFLKSSALALFGVGAAPQWLARAAAGPERKKILVAVLQRGAADGLNIVVPHGDTRYAELRPTIGIARNTVIDLDGYFGLHPQLEPLKALYDSKQLAIVHATGSPDATRSHFDAQDYMESGTPGLKSTSDGWMNRALPRETNPSPLRAVSASGNLAKTLRGPQAAVAIGNVNDFQVRDRKMAGDYQSMYAASSDARLQTAGKETFEAMRMLESVRRANPSPDHGAVYPKGRLGQSLHQVAQLAKGNVGLEAAFADMGGWDHHTNELPQMENQLREFGQALAAFHRDLGDRMEDVVVVTMSEFGRTARENGTRGTDHGHANVMFAMGGGIHGGRVAGRWPGLETEQLYEGRDLAVTTDFRDVLGEVVTAHLGLGDLQTVFPGFRPGAAPGLFRG
ncbi:DUF1501 domain-containing protein [Paludibaculum fermentans]|uniref:DUF1501 domain-containing protein n=1 Tax=Paludibaculum fermentans TaxID=1473598 RepID=A0A7S7SIM8_PALFE|nr:DUF1501 domain-containing protein [Paludibaculum fermentans]QOY85838.1 DUF1501 domain-containing protein [Paludibaculum fermentans]